MEEKASSDKLCLFVILLCNVVALYHQKTLNCCSIDHLKNDRTQKATNYVDCCHAKKPNLGLSCLLFVFLSELFPHLSSEGRKVSRSCFLDFYKTVMIKHRHLQMLLRFYRKIAIKFP